MIKRYLNLTNGIEAIEDYGLTDYSFIRIQSTACEQKLWDRVLLDLDNDFLMNVALGNTCVIYDYGARKPIPRALYQGVALIKFALQKVWLGYADDVYIRRSNKSTGVKATEYFDKCFQSLSDQVIHKLGYFKKFFNGKITIVCVSNSTVYDGKYDYYVNVLNHRQQKEIKEER